MSLSDECHTTPRQITKKLPTKYFCSQLSAEDDYKIVFAFSKEGFEMDIISQNYKVKVNFVENEVLEAFIKFI